MLDCFVLYQAALPRALDVIEVKYLGVALRTRGDSGCSASYSFFAHYKYQFTVKLEIASQRSTPEYTFKNSMTHGKLSHWNTTLSLEYDKVY